MTARPTDPHAGGSTGPIRLLAGSAGPERRAPRPDPAEPRWYEPLHVRDAAAARERVAGLVVAGADLIVAPSWLTHRRALLPIGETRRAREWTAAATRVARQGIEMGLERRERQEGTPSQGARYGSPDADATASPAPAVAIPRHPVLVAGWLPSLDGAAEADSGRLAPRDVASARDLRSQAGILAETGVDLVVVEAPGGVDGARLATEAAAETGLATWVAGRPIGSAAAPTMPDGADPEAWAEALVHAGARTLLLDAADVAVGEAALRRIAMAVPVPVGLLAARGMESTVLGASASHALEAGARQLGALDGATLERVAAIRAALDAHEGERLAAAARDAVAWTAVVTEGARRAPGGAAAWITVSEDAAPDRGALPKGFAWSLVPPRAAASLPEERFALVIVEGGGGRAMLGRLALALAPGGILVARIDPDALGVLLSGDAADRMRIVATWTLGGDVAVVARREG